MFFFRQVLGRCMRLPLNNKKGLRAVNLLLTSGCEPGASCLKLKILSATAVGDIEFGTAAVKELGRPSIGRRYSVQIASF